MSSQKRMSLNFPVLKTMHISSAQLYTWSRSCCSALQSSSPTIPRKSLVSSAKDETPVSLDISAEITWTFTESNGKSEMEKFLMLHYRSLEFVNFPQYFGG